MTRVPRLACLGLLTCLITCALVIGAFRSRPVFAQALPDNCFTGTWDTNLGTMRLIQDGDTVTGDYADGLGRIEGILTEDVLRGSWAEGPTNEFPFIGRFFFRIMPDCAEFHGTYGFNGDDSSAGFWSGTRIDGAPAMVARVVAPNVTYGDVVRPPGSIFYPAACTTRANEENNCGFVIARFPVVVPEPPRVEVSCWPTTFDAVKLILSLSLASTDEDRKEAIFDFVFGKPEDVCDENRFDGNHLDQNRLDAYRQTTAEPWLGIRLSQGALVVGNPLVGQSLSVDAHNATAVTDGAATFMADYNPVTGESAFAAYTGTLTLTPTIGTPLVLQQGEAVTVTAAGFGPVKTLPLVFIPMTGRP